MNAHKEAFLARQSGPPAMQDGLIETAGLSGDEEVDAEETEEILADEETMAAIDEGLEDLAEGAFDDLEEGAFDDLEEDDTIQALADMTVAELEELADVRGIDYPSHIRKADLIELIASS